MNSDTEKHRGNTGNLKPWKPGQSGNPAGRPRKEDSLTSLLKGEMERIDPNDVEGRTWNERIVVATLRLAEQGLPAALKEIWERMDGKVRQDVGVGIDLHQEITAKLQEALQRERKMLEAERINVETVYAEGGSGE